MLHTRSTTAFRKTAETLPAGAKTLPQKYFISPDIFAEEVNRIFANNWVLIGHQSQIANSGDYFVAVVAGESLVVVRDKEGVIRAFYNVCVIAARGLKRTHVVMCPRSSVRTMRGRTGLMAD
jgi:phenylpropionate dioxygenase-like ring-hydroxylating dioxygenase large terminal subunit